MGDRNGTGTALQTVVFHEPKAGSAPSEWEDGAGYAPADPATGRPARLVAVDGATEAFDSVRWVHQLVSSFLGDDGRPPALRAADLDVWFGRMQQRWVDEAPRQFANIFAERAFHDAGSFATFLGCEVAGLGGPGPTWRAAAVGDTVLFHVRDGVAIAQFPRMAAGDFGINPDGVFTLPSQRNRMRAGLAFGDGALEVGDVLYLATDALAAWLVNADADVWRDLAGLEHWRVFRWMVADLRRRGALKNDDVTLLRAAVTPVDVEVLVVCR
jgi:hypothetical protein